MCALGTAFRALCPEHPRYSFTRVVHSRAHPRTSPFAGGERGGGIPSRKTAERGKGARPCRSPCHLRHRRAERWSLPWNGRGRQRTERPAGSGGTEPVRSMPVLPRWAGRCQPGLLSARATLIVHPPVRFSEPLARRGVHVPDVSAATSFLFKAERSRRRAAWTERPAWADHPIRRTPLGVVQSGNTETSGIVAVDQETPANQEGRGRRRCPLWRKGRDERGRCLALAPFTAAVSRSQVASAAAAQTDRALRAERR
jgi:hypothetical protein